MIEKVRPKSVINRSPKKNDDFSHGKVLSCDFFDVFVVLPFREHTKKNINFFYCILGSFIS